MANPTATFILCLCGTFTLAAQEIEIRAGQVRAKADTNLMSAPRNGAVKLAKIASGAELRWLDGRKSGTFSRVVGRKGPVGWVKTNKLEVVSQPPPLSAGAGLELASPPCAPNLAGCDAIGCAEAGSAHAAANQQKRSFPTGTPLALTFEDFVALQEQSDNLVGQAVELSADERATIHDLTLPSGTAGEGTNVELVGFIGAGLAPHPNSGESVNCRLKTSKNNDFHISLVESAGQADFDGIVIEMIPQDRPEGWTIAKLNRIRTLGRMIKITGGLFYDNLHAVNNDAANPIGGQPARFSLWEIHPIAKFHVCKKADNSCDPATASDWKTLNAFQ